MSRPVITQAKCRFCGADVLIVDGEAYEPEVADVLVPNAFGEFEIVKAHPEHECPE